MPDHTPTKCCSKCGTEYPATTEYFHRHKNHGRVGLRPECKSCTSKQQGYKYTPRQINPVCPDGYQYCRTCQTVQPMDVSHFSFRKDRNRYSTECRHCSRIRINAWCARNSEKRRLSSKKHRIKYSSEERIRKRKYQDQNRDKVNANTHRYRARKQALPASFTAFDWNRAVNYFNGCCAVCGRPPGLWHKLAQDHWMPVALGGAYTPDNIVPICDGIDGCNESKNKHLAHDWLIKKFGPRKAKIIETRIADYFEWVKQQ